MKFIVHALLLSLFVLHGQPSNSQNIPNGVTVPTGNAPKEPLPNPYPTSIGSNPTLLNYERTFIPRDNQSNPALIDEGSSVSVTKMSTNYYDGVGRQIESVYRGAGKTTAEDIIKVQDNRPGPTSLDFLPYPFTLGYGYFRYDPFNEQQGYYSSQFPNESTSGSACTQCSNVASYSKNEYSSSSAARTNTFYEPGKSGQTSGNGTSITTALNAYMEVMNWQLDFQTYLPSLSGWYTAGVLTKTITTGPNGEHTEEFTNKNGLLICRRVSVTSGTYLQINNSFYLYDNLGRRVLTITPKAFEKLYMTVFGSAGLSIQGIVDGLCDYVKYDKAGRIYERHIAGQTESSPGQSSNTFYVYDKQFRPILTQTPTLRSQNKWSYTQYDNLGRVLTSGLYTNTTSTRQDLQNWFDGVVTLPSIQNSNSSIVYYLYNSSAHSSYPASLSDAEVLAINYYDNYTNSTISSRFYNPTMFFGNLAGNTAITTIPSDANEVYGKLTGRQVKVLKPVGSSLQTWLTTVYFYDIYERLLQTQTQNQLGGWDYISTDYDYNGNVQNSVVYHSNPASAKNNTLIVNTLVYISGTDKLLQVKQKIDNGAWQVLTQYTYDRLGNILSHNIGTLESQGIERNISGALTGINRWYAEGGTAAYGVTFGEAIKYEYGFSQSKLGGKASGMIWRGAGASPSRAYGYSYDLANRLIQADFTEKSPISGTWNNYNTDFSVDNLNYDANGNIKSMRQKGMVWTTTSSGPVYSPQTIDDLSYSYEGSDVSNRLKEVTDNITTNFQSNDFFDGNTADFDYGYDANGNLTLDKNKAIAGITYNFLNQPVNVTFSSGATLDYIYDAEGNKLQEKIYDGTSTKTLDYAGPCVYSNNTIQYLIHDEGKAAYERNTTTNAWEWKYYYFVKDHLNNVRSVVTPVQISWSEYMATHEVAVAHIENAIFANMTDVVAPLPGSSTSSTNSEGALLDATYQNKKIGTSLLLHVMAGDQIELSSDSYYDSYDAQNCQQTPPEDMVGSLVSALMGGVNNIPSEGGMNNHLVLNNLLNSGEFLNAYQGLRFNALDPDKPQAFLNYVVFDENMHVINEESGMIQVSQAGNWVNLSTNGALTLDHNGYVAVFISNASASPVYFDNVRATFYKGGLVDEQHYYPYGLPIFSGVTNPLERKYLYQSKEWRNENDLKWFDFHARQYDPQIGRFHSLDAARQFNSGYIGMGNNPVLTTDPDGNYAVVDDLVAIGLGGIFNVAGNWSNIHGFGQGLSYFVVGAAAGETTLYAGPIAGGAVNALGNGVVGHFSQKGATFKNMDWTGLAYNTALGGIIGGVSGGINIPGISGIANKVLSQAVNGAIGGSVVGAIGSAIGSVMSGSNDFWGDVGRGTLWGAATGAASGSIQGYKETIEARNTPPSSNDIRPEIGDKSSSGEADLPELAPAQSHQIGENEGGLVLYKSGSAQATTPEGWNTGDRFLNFPGGDLGSPKANWKRNSGNLRREMGYGKPIGDSYRTSEGTIIQTKGFLNAERYQMQTRGWQYNIKSGKWVPPPAIKIIYK